MKISSVQVEEIFSSILILNAIIGISELANLKQRIATLLKGIILKSGKIRFFNDPELLSPDVDDTCLALIPLLLMSEISKEEISLVIEEIKNNKKANNGFFVYFLKEAKKIKKFNRVDLVVDVNVATFLRLIGEPDIQVERNIFSFLGNYKYRTTKKLRYYFPAGFLYFLGRMLEFFPEIEVDKQFFFKAVNCEIEQILKKPFVQFPFPSFCMLLTSSARLGQRVDDFLIGLLLSFLSFSAQDNTWAVIRAGSKKHFYGSPAISLALAAETLAKIREI